MTPVCPFGITGVFFRKNDKTQKGELIRMEKSKNIIGSVVVKFKLSAELLNESDGEQTVKDLRKQIQWWLINESNFCGGLVDKIEFEIERN